MATRVVTGEGSVPVHKPSRRSRVRMLWNRLVAGKAHPWIYALALTLWASSWDLRLSVLLSWLPLEPVWLASLLLGGCVVHRLGRPLVIRPGVAGPLVLLVVCFTPGALQSSPGGYGTEKGAQLLLVVLPVVVAATVLLDVPETRRAWAGAQLVCGGAVAVAAVTTGHADILQPGRFTLSTVNTVPASRLVGIAFVVLVLIAATSIRRAWLAFPAAALCGAVLVQIGSRGPLLFAVLAVLAVLVVGRRFAERRIAPLALAALFSAIAYAYAYADGGEGGQRVVSSLRQGLVDETRAAMLGDAVRAGLAHPFGVGWGDFLDYSQTASRIANAHGVSYAHNLFAEAFSEGGIPALVGLAVVVLLAVKRQWKLTDLRVEAVVWGSLLFWLLNALVSLDLVGNRFMWIALACGLASRRAEEAVRDGGDNDELPESRLDVQIGMGGADETGDSSG